MLTCTEFIEDLLADYVDGALEPEAVGELEAHLTKCPPCVAYLNTYRKTRDVVGLAGAAQMPPEMKDILRQLMVRKLKRPGS
jgi:anti-sigma factor RsiW